MKTCSQCETVKPLDDFHRKAAARDGRTSRCKSCLAAQNARYRARKPYGNRRTRIPEGATWLRVAHLATGKRKYANLYTIWHCMRQRCQCPTYIGYPWYGARGITICPEWDDFATFREWAIANGFRKGLTLDRIDSDGHYTPDNCRWADRETQVYNSSNTKQITFRGETKPGPIWAREFGLTPAQFRQRLKDGWDVERALTTPINEKLRHHQHRSVTDEQIRWARSCGLPAKEVAAELGLSLNYVRRILIGAVYGDVA